MEVTDGSMAKRWRNLPTEFRARLPEVLSPQRRRELVEGGSVGGNADGRLARVRVPRRVRRSDTEGVRTLAEAAVALRRRARREAPVVELAVEA